MAYPLLARSRLGCSPNLSFDRAYHTTSCKSRRNTNRCHEKKLRGLPASSPAARFGQAPTFFCPGAQPPQLFPRSWKRWPFAAREFRTISAFIIAPSKKRTQYMSNPMSALPPVGSIPPRPRSEPCGALAAETCLVPVPALPGPSTPPEVRLPEQSASAAPAPRQSARCSVKGCVFPAPLQGHTKCHYHELLQSEGELFQSHQPSRLLALYAPFGVPDDEPDDSRQQDRKRQAAEREAFLLDDAPEGRS